MKRKQTFRRAFSGYLGFFLIVAVTVTAAVMIYSLVDEVYDGDKKAISLIMLVVCLGLSLCCSTFDAVRRSLTVDRSVERILEATEMIMHGNFDVRLTPRHPFKRYDDLDEIMANVNEMALELSKNEVLKSDFISSVSHEIKTPLAIIQNYASALLDEDLSKEKRTEYIKVLSQATKRLNDLVVNILRLNKLENQRIDSKTEKIRLDEALTESIFAIEDLIDEKSIDLTCDFDEISIVSSLSHLEIIWNNLLSNAVKFTPKGGKINVSLKKNGDKAVLKVADNGCGMDDSTGKRIFDKFYQGDTSHKTEGNGLGLALVKKSVDLLGAKITVESELNKGTTFKVYFKDVLDE